MSDLLGETTQFARDRCHAAGDHSDVGDENRNVNITITAVSVIVALVIGGLETLGLVQSAFNLGGLFWDPVALPNDHFGTLGYVIIGIFVASWAISVMVYKLNRYDEVDVKMAE